MGIRYLIWFAVAAIAIYVTYTLYAYATDSPYRIDASVARRRLAAGEIDYVLDVRTAFERDALGYYPQSIHIPSAELRRRVEQEIPNKSAAILVYCNTGQRARAATDLLHRLGYRNAVYIATGHASLMD